MRSVTQQHLHRSTTNKMVAGVCGGLGEFLGIDATIVRLVVLLLVIPFSILIGLFYVALVLLLPPEKPAPMAG
ncbi:MAG TPA: PspC domain-containing protein [Ktedonobacterales bacterium]